MGSPDFAEQESHEVAISKAMGEAHYKIEKQSREAERAKSTISYELSLAKKMITFKTGE